MTIEWEDLNARKTASDEAATLTFMDECLLDRPTAVPRIGRFINSQQQSRKSWNGRTWEYIVAMFLGFHCIPFAEQVSFCAADGDADLAHHRLDFVIGPQWADRAALPKGSAKVHALRESVVISAKTCLRERGSQDVFLHGKCAHVYQLTCDPTRKPMAIRPHRYNTVVNIYDPIQNFDWLVGELDRWLSA